jgi:hypothetical protein
MIFAQAIRFHVYVQMRAFGFFIHVRAPLKTRPSVNHAERQTEDDRRLTVPATSGAAAAAAAPPPPPPPPPGDFEAAPPPGAVGRDAHVLVDMGRPAPPTSTSLCRKTR